MADVPVVSNEGAVRPQIEDGGWHIAWGGIFEAKNGFGVPKDVPFNIPLVVSFPGSPLPPVAGVRPWAITQLGAQAAKANKNFVDIPSKNVEAAISELESYLKQNRIGAKRFGDIGVKSGFAMYQRWDGSKLGPSGPTGDPRQELPNAFQPYIGIRVVFPEPPAPPPAPPPSGPPPASPFQRFKLHAGTLLHPTDATFAFALTDWNGDGFQDLVAIKKSGTGTGSTEVHIFSGSSNFRNLLLTAGTPLPETDHTYAFALADWNGDGRPDLFAIQKSKTDSGSTEVNILSGSSNFQDWLLRKAATGLHETDENFDFVVADWNGDGKPDLITISKKSTGTKMTEVHILSGESGFQKWLLQIGTGLHETNANWAFAATNWNGGSRPDLVCINRAGQSSTEVGILSGASFFKEFFFNGSTPLHKTDSAFDFAIADWDKNGRPDLFAIKKSGADTDSTEVHILGE